MSGCLKFLFHCARERNVCQLVIATCLALLAEIYSTYHVLIPGTPGLFTQSGRPCFRLEYGRSPIADFGICKGKVKGRTNRLQTWTYYDPSTDTRTMPLDPDNYYWIYFRTVNGEELILDCCGYSLGMEGCVDASACLTNLPPTMCVPGSTQVPAYFRSDRDAANKFPHTLIEEKRFPVMQNTTLHKAIATDMNPEQFQKDSDEVKIVRAFMEQVAERECTDIEIEVLLWWRGNGSGILREILRGRHWQEWEKPVLHQKSLYDNRAVITKGVKDPTVYDHNLEPPPGSH